MPSVLLVHGNTEWYGSDRSLVLLATAVRDLGWDVEVAIPGPGHVEDRLTGAGIVVHHRDAAPLRGRVFGPTRLARYFVYDLPMAAFGLRGLARRFDVVHANASILMGAIVGGSLARRPVVLHVRETYEGSERAWRAYARLVGPLVARVVAISEATAEEARATAFGGRVTVVHNGLDFDAAPKAPPDGSAVVAIGRINEWKGHDVLLRAIALLRARGIDCPVEIAGAPFPGQEDCLAGLHRLAESLGITDLVRFLGYVDDVAELLARTAVFVQPSTRPEPFGLSLLDALGSGVASVATDAGGPRDIVRNGETGLLVPPGDPRALADAIERLWLDSDLRIRLGTAAATDVRARFSIEATARDMVRLYEQVLERAPRRGDSRGWGTW